MREMCGYPGCEAPEIEFVAGEGWYHVTGYQGHTAVVGTPAKFPRRVEAVDNGSELEQGAFAEPQIIGSPLDSLPRNARRLVELSTADWTMRWSTSPTFVIVQGRRNGHQLHASWRNGKFEGCFVDQVIRLSSKEMFEYVQREDLTK